MFNKYDIVIHNGVMYEILEVDFEFYTYTVKLLPSKTIHVKNMIYINAHFKLIHKGIYS